MTNQPKLTVTDMNDGTVMIDDKRGDCRHVIHAKKESLEPFFGDNLVEQAEDYLKKGPRR